MIRDDVDWAIARAYTFPQFLTLLEGREYEVKKNVKHIAIRPKGKERFVRLKSLGSGYTEEALRDKIYKKKSAVNRKNNRAKHLIKSKKKNRLKLTGIRADYYRYLNKLGILTQNKHRKYIPHSVRDDALKFNNLIAEIQLLNRNHIDTAEELFLYRRKIKEEIGQKSKYRYRLNKNLKEGNPQSIDEMDTQTLKVITELNSTIRKLYRKLHLCDDVLVRSGIIKEKLKELDEKERELKEEQYHGKYGRRSR